MKKFTFLTTALFMLVIACGNLKAQVGLVIWSDLAEKFTGDGDKDKPFIISKAEHLAYLAVKVNEDKNYSLNKYFKLDNDIDLVGTSQLGERNEGITFYWDLPIGTKTSPFQGTFDGNNYRIVNMLLDGFWYFPQQQTMGLFGYTEDATIKNVCLEGVNSHYIAHTVVGSLVGHALNTSIEYCKVKRFEITGVQKYAGGLIGEAHGKKTTVKNSSASGKIIDVGSNCFTGGFAGYVADGTITYCDSEGEISGTSVVGGFIGNVGEGRSTIRYCHSKSKTIGISSVGGFIGLIKSAEVQIKDCRTSGLTLGVSDHTGGFIGIIQDGNGEVKSCLAEGMVTGNTHVGGFIGGLTGMTLNSMKITNCSSTGVTESIKGSTGGFVGYASSNVLFSGCFATGAVKGETDVGGFVGSIHTTVTDCFATGKVEGYKNVGGFAGNTDAILTNCFAVGTVKGHENVGGFAGRIRGRGRLFNDPVSGDIFNPENCFSAGTVFCENEDRSGAFVGNLVNPRQKT